MKDLSANDPSAVWDESQALKKDVDGKRARILTAATLVLIPIVYFYPAVLGRVMLAPGDGWTQILGIRVLIGQMIRSGHLPLWNPFIFSGMPLLASIQPGALYPPTWLFIVFSPQMAMNWMVITTYHIALIGAYLYARRIGCNRLGAIIAGIAFAFGGFMAAHLGHTNRIAAAAWAPWILLAIEELYLAARWRWVALGALFIALQLFAGDPQMTCYTIIVAGAYGLFSITLREPRERRSRFLLASFAMSVIGLLLSAIQLLPERELLQLGERSGIPYEYFSGFSLPPQHLFQTVFPYFFGGAGMSPYGVTYWGKWNTTETASYVGMLAMLLVVIAIMSQFTQKKHDRLVWFWSGCAVLAVFLAFGSYLPISIHKFLYQIPVYNLFRASGRHMLEVDLALGVLAGLGATWISRRNAGPVLRVTLAGVGLMALIVAATAIVYRFFADRLVMDLPVTEGAKSFSNAELIVPVVFFVLSAAALVWYALFRGSSGVLKNGAVVAMITLFLADVASFGFFYEWNIVPPDLSQRLADSPTVKYIKDRESDINSFRVLSYGSWPHVRNYELLDFPNISIGRGLQSVNGYDPVVLSRYSEMAGRMSLDGVVQETTSFGPNDQSFNLLGVKYLFLEQPEFLKYTASIERDGVRFIEAPVNLVLKPGGQINLRAEATATEFAVISAMGMSNEIPNDAPVVTINFHTRDGRIIERQMKAGRDTSEWAYDRVDVRANIKHDRARITETFPEKGFEGHYYLARFPFDRSEIERITLKYEPDAADVTLVRATLYDAGSGQWSPITAMNLTADRWRKLTQIGEVEVLENTKALPRAWFARRAVIESSADVLRIIKTGKLKDGSAFNPADTVLLDKEDVGNRAVVPAQIGAPAGGGVKVTRYEPQRIEINTSNEQTGFLVLSEIYYRGWEAWIDGHRAPVERVNHLLRGLAVPAGDHRVEFVFRAPSFTNGAKWSLFGVLLLFLGASKKVRRGYNKTESRLESSITRIWTSTRFWTSVRSRTKWAIGRISAAVVSVFLLVSKSRWIMIAPLIGLLIYGGVLVKNTSYGVGGSDSSGYARIARSILKGDIVQRIPELDSLGLSDEFSPLFIPLAYDRGPAPKTMAPFYPVGLPMLLAAGALIGGWDHGPYLVSPITALLSLLLLYLVGLELGLPRGFSVAGAVMLAAAPTFIYMSLQPMSDEVAMFWALVVILFSLRARKRNAWALFAGAAFGMAFLTRPTNILLLIPILFSLPLKPKTLLYFILGGLPLAGVFLAYNAVAYGNPLRTGYLQIGLFGALKLSNFPDRFIYYRLWLTRTLGPVLLLGWLGVAVNWKVHWRDRGMLISWFGSFFLLYSFYNDYDAWWYTRFLLPGYPALVLGTLLVARDIPGLLKNQISEANQARLKWAVMLILLGVTLSHERRYIRRFDVFSIGLGENWHPASCRWADKQLPDRSLVLSMQMSGAMNFYTQRSIVRWDWVIPDVQAPLKQHAAEKGYQWYALLLPFEIEDAQSRFKGKWTKLGMLDQISLWRIEAFPD